MPEVDQKEDGRDEGRNIFLINAFIWPGPYCKHPFGGVPVALDWLHSMIIDFVCSKKSFGQINVYTLSWTGVHCTCTLPFRVPFVPPNSICCELSVCLHSLMETSTSFWQLACINGIWRCITISLHKGPPARQYQPSPYGFVEANVNKCRTDQDNLRIKTTGKVKRCMSSQASIYLFWNAVYLFTSATRLFFRESAHCKHTVLCIFFHLLLATRSSIALSPFSSSLVTNTHRTKNSSRGFWLWANFPFGLNTRGEKCKLSGYKLANFIS